MIAADLTVEQRVLLARWLRADLDDTRAVFDLVEADEWLAQVNNHPEESTPSDRRAAWGEAFAARDRHDQAERALGDATALLQEHDLLDVALGLAGDAAALIDDLERGRTA